MTTNELYSKLIQIFEQKYIKEYSDGSLVINDTDKNAHFNCLAIEKRSHAILFADTFLKNFNNSFKGDPAPELNRECDGIVITEYNGKKYIILVELKSKFETGMGKGPKQLLASCFKTLTLFSCIDGFSFNDYNLCAVLALQKPTPESLNKVRQKKELKEDLKELDLLKIEVNKNDIVQSEISRKKFLFDTLPIKETFCHDLPLFIFTVKDDKTSGTMNLDKILSMV